MPPQYTKEYSESQQDLGDLRKQLRANGYPPVPITRHNTKDPSYGKRPLMEDWRTACLDADDAAIERWSRERPTETNTGIVTGTVVGLDIDFHDPITVHHLEALAFQKLGYTPLQRTGLFPKTLLVYRTDTLFSKEKTTDFRGPKTPPNKSEKIEVLAAGQQFVAFGIHPDTRKPYTWGKQTPLDTPLADLPVVTLEKVRAFLDATTPIIVAAGYAPVGSSTDTDPRQPRDRTHYEAPAIDEIAAAAAALPNDADYDGWVRIAMAIFEGTGGSDDGFKIFNDWSRKWPGYSARDTAKKWKSLRRKPPRDITVATLFGQANKAAPGWRSEHDCKVIAEFSNMIRHTSDMSFEEFLNALPADAPMVCFDYQQHKTVILPKGSPEYAKYLEQKQQWIAERIEQQQHAAEAPADETAPDDDAAPNVDGTTDESQADDQTMQQRKRRSGIKLNRLYDSYGSPSVEWRVKKMILKQTVALLVGQWGTFKSTVALNLAASLMTGMPFFGHRITEKCGVLYVAAEGVSGITKRMRAALVQKKSKEFDDVNILEHPFIWIDCQPNLRQDGAKSLVDIARDVDDEFQDRFQCRLGAIFIDTMMASGGVLDENDAAQIQHVMNSLGNLARETGTAVIGIDHAGKNAESGARGSSAKEAAVDTVLMCVGDRTVTGEIKNLEFAIRKCREGESGFSIPFRRELIDLGVDEDGDEITVAIVHPDPERRQRTTRKSEAQHRFEAAFGMMMTKHGELITLDNGQRIPRAIKFQTVRDAFIQNCPTTMSAATKRKRWERGCDAALEAQEVAYGEAAGVVYLWPVMGL